MHVIWSTSKIRINRTNRVGTDRSPFLIRYEACPECKDIKVLNMYNIFNLQKRHCE